MDPSAIHDAVSQAMTDATDTSSGAPTAAEPAPSAGGNGDAGGTPPGSSTPDTGATAGQRTSPDASPKPNTPTQTPSRNRATPPAASVPATGAIDIDGELKKGRSVSPALVTRMIAQVRSELGTSQTTATADAVKAESARVLALTGLDEATLKESNAGAHLRALIQNPHAYAKWLTENLGPDPSVPLTTPNSTPAATPKTTPAPIVPDFQDDRGTGFYSAARMEELLKRQREDLLGEVDTRMKPFNEQQALAVKADLDRRADEYAINVLKEAAKWEGFSDLKPHIKTLMTSHGLTLEQAYIRAYQTNYLPQREERSRKAFHESLKNKPVVTTDSPSRAARTDAAPSTTKRGGISVREAVERAIEGVS